jgi:ADYC domain
MNPGGPRRQPRWAVLCTGLVLFATAAQAAWDEGYQSEQGTRVRGTVNDSLERLDLRLSSATYEGSPFTQLWIDRGELQGQWGSEFLTGETLVGAHFSALDTSGELVDLRIVGARPHTNVYTRLPSKTVWEYDVEWESKAGSGSLCPGNAPALALPGKWNAGAYLPSPDAFSFACVPYETPEVGLLKGGVAAKCVDWGYPPWLNEDEMPDGGKSPVLSGGDAKRYHAVCATMASADYCGEGRPNTVDGTPIVMFNDSNVRTEVEASDPTHTPYVSGGPFGTSGDFFFEAAWTAVPVKDDREGEGWRGKALCLTKKRWSTLPLNGTCFDPSSLPDPRTNRDEEYCESRSAEELLALGSVLFSYSTYIDAGLYRFKNKNTGALLTTASVTIKSWPAFAYVPNVPDGDEYELDTYGTSSVFEGSILSRNVPSTFPYLDQTSRLLRYTDGAGRYVTLLEGAVVPAGYVFEELEGYVFTKPPPMSVPELHLWQQLGSYATTRGDLGALGYVDVGWMGYLPSLSDYSQMQ